MMRRCPALRRGTRRRGAAAVATVVLMLMLGLIMMTMVVVGTRHQDLTILRLEATRSLYAGEAAAHLALRELALNEDLDGDGTIGTIEPISRPEFGGASAHVEASIDGNTATLVAYGRGERTERRIELTTALGSDGTGFPGLVSYYHIADLPPGRLSDIDWEATPDAMACAPRLHWPPTLNSTPFWIGGPNNNYGARFLGYIHVPDEGLWTFHTESDDGSRLFINDEVIVDNDGVHPMRRRSGTVQLEEGWHDFEVRFFDRGGTHGLIVSWEGPGTGGRTVIPHDAFAYTDTHLLQPLPKLAVREHFNMWGRGPGWHNFIDGYDGSAGAYDSDDTVDALVSTNATSDNAVELSRATIYGDLRIGPGGNPDSAVALYKAAAITGDVQPHSIPITTPQIIVPDDLPSSGGRIRHRRGTHDYDEDFRCDSWSIGNNGVVNVTSSIVGRIDGDFNVTGNARINIASGAMLTLYVGGEVNIKDNAEINTGTADASRLRIYMVGSGRNMTMDDRSTAYADVINPEGGIRISGRNPMPQSQLFGTLYSRFLEMDDRTMMHIDQRTVPVDAESSGLVVTGWQAKEPIAGGSP